MMKWMTRILFEKHSSLNTLDTLSSRHFHFEVQKFVLIFLDLLLIYYLFIIYYLLFIIYWLIIDSYWIFRKIDSFLKNNSIILMFLLKDSSLFWCSF